MPLARNTSNLTKYFIVAAIVLSLLVVYFYILTPTPSTTSTSNNVQRDCKPQKTANCPTTCPPVTPCQCFDPNAQGPPTGDGQVHMGTSFGQALNKLAKQSDVNLFLEIGTWFVCVFSIDLNL